MIVDLDPDHVLDQDPEAIPDLVLEVIILIQAPAIPDLEVDQELDLGPDLGPEEDPDQLPDLQISQDEGDLPPS